MQPGVSRPQPKSRGVLTIGIGAALLSATGQPAPKLFNQLVGMGLPDLAARLTLHAIPVVLILGAVLIGQMAGRGRSKNVRWALYGLLGAVAGFFTAFCLDLLVGVPAMIEALNGPLAEPEVIEIALWAFGGVTIATGLMVAAIAAFGPPAAYAMNLEPDICEDALDIRKPERKAYGVSSIGLIALGVASIALSIARQSGPDAVLGPCIVAMVAGAISIMTNLVLWKGLDELQRRQVVDAFSVSAVFMTIGAFAWAIGQTLGLLPPVDVAGAFVSVSILQLVVTMVVSAAAAGDVRAKRRTA
jgi:hypothetical protein